ncbi:MAG: hypothetical protein R3C01_07710 [Planctomycetaceae bacterium]
MRSPYRSVGLALVVLVLLTGVIVPFTQSAPAADEPKPVEPAEGAATPQVVPVETSMHEIMEYAFEEPYKRLRVAMATPIASDNRAAWRGVKSDALLLAEGGNLLLSRGPKENRKLWDEHAIAIRSTGAELYKATKARDHAAARPHWEALVRKCNACHDDFAKGEHQLAQ